MASIKPSYDDIRELTHRAAWSTARRFAPWVLLPLAGAAFYREESPLYAAFLAGASAAFAFGMVTTLRGYLRRSRAYGRTYREPIEMTFEQEGLSGRTEFGSWFYKRSAIRTIREANDHFEIHLHANERPFVVARRHLSATEIETIRAWQSGTTVSQPYRKSMT